MTRKTGDFAWGYDPMRFQNNIGTEEGFKFVGAPGERLYRQGTCLKCKAPIFGYEKKRRNHCGCPECTKYVEKKFPCKKLTGPLRVGQW